jgi:aerobic-type carbon monoxide dehydrogenase small subunit (CoxS/CutS family)
MSLTHLLETEPTADDERIKEVIDGVLCRCTGYACIFEAAIAARDSLRAQRAS